MSSAKAKLSFPESLVIWDSAKKETNLDRWIDRDLEFLEEQFSGFITVQSARRAAQAVVSEIAKSR